jgi:hypothetical protein
MTDLPGGSAGRRASELFHGATTDLAPDVDRIVQGGVARGRTLRRRRRVGTSLAAAAVVGVLGVAASAGSQLLGDAEQTPIGFADTGTAADAATDAPPTESPSTPPSTNGVQDALPPGAYTTLPIDALVVVSAESVPGVIGELVPGGTVGEPLEDPPYGVADLRQQKTVHFRYEGTLTTFVIERADTLATCAEQIDPANQADGEPGGECIEQDGVTLLTWGPDTADGVTAQGVSAFVHGYVVSALSYNAADGKDVTPILAEPPLSMGELTTIVTSEEWFGE